MKIIFHSELFSFPAGSIAAVIISGVVLIMIIVKVVCVMTGHDRPLSDACYQGEDQKKILAFEADVQHSKLEYHNFRWKTLFFFFYTRY